MHLISNIEENEFVNKLNWTALSCHDKALAIASEALIKDSSLYFLLFKFAGRDNLVSDTNMGIGGEQYYRYIEQESGLEFRRVYKSSESLKEELHRLARKNKVAVFVVNTKFQNGARLAGKKDHPHFMVYKGFSEKGYHFIDEDWSKEYWHIKENETDVYYVERIIGFEELEALACGISSCNVFSADQAIKASVGLHHFMYYEVIDSGNKTCNLGVVQQKFEDSFSRYLEKKDEHYSYILEEMVRFKEKLVSRRNETIQEVNSRLTPDEQAKDKEAMRMQEISARKDQIFAIRSRFIYPFESELIGAHANFLYTLTRIIELRTNGFSGKDLWIVKSKELLSKYEMIKLQISRGVILADISIIDRALTLFSVAFKEECDHYLTLLRSGWKLEEFKE